MTDKQISLRMDPRLYNAAKAAHQRFNGQQPGLSFNSFLEVCINEWLSEQAPDLHAVAFNKVEDPS